MANYRRVDYSSIGGEGKCNHEFCWQCLAPYREIRAQGLEGWKGHYEYCKSVIFKRFFLFHMVVRISALDASQCHWETSRQLLSIFLESASLLARC